MRAKDGGFGEGTAVYEELRCVDFLQKPVHSRRADLHLTSDLADRLPCPVELSEPGAIDFDARSSDLGPASSRGGESCAGPLDENPRRMAKTGQ